MKRLRLVLIALFCGASMACAADVPATRLQATILPGIEQRTYTWQVTPVGDTAQLLTLFCRSCRTLNDDGDGVPLVTVLRDTLGDIEPENDRVSYVWLLSYARPNAGQRVLSAVPFFYWRVADGSKSVSSGDTAPLLNLTAPQRPVASDIGRNLLQWTMLDPMTTPIRATSRAYRTNEVDHARLHLEEAISYLRNAPTGTSDNALTETQLNTVIARLALRKRVLGGFVPEGRAARVGQEDGFEQERIRSRNWELLRQCAERTGLIFESVDIAGNAGQYGILWFPLDESLQAGGTSLGAVWKLLNIKNPWRDSRLRHGAKADELRSPWPGQQYDRSLDENGSLLPAGVQGARQVRLVPLAVYSLNYPKLPLLLVDFRDKLHIRRHEMTQRTINEITAGVIGISHVTNWYYYVGADLYNFITARHGAAVNQAARLDCYSQFRVELALDHQLDPALRKEMEQRIESLAVNPLEAAPDREIELAQMRYSRLQAEAQDGGRLLVRLDRDRRAELAGFGKTRRARVAYSLLHDASFGLYTHRAQKDVTNVAVLDRERRIQHHLNFLDSLVESGTRPEVAYDRSRIEASLNKLSGLMFGVHAPELRAHAEATIRRLQGLSQDAGLQVEYELALAALKPDMQSRIAVSAHHPAAATRTLALAGMESHK
jgi:hypothetical protein